MKLLLDQSSPRKLRTLLPGHLVRTAWEEGWSTLANGDLLRAAELHGFDVMITADQNIVYQQNNASRRISLVVLSTTNWTAIQPFADEVAQAVARCKPGSYERIDVPKLQLPKGQASSS